MTVVRAQCSFQLDTAFPKDAIVFTPHFNTGAPFADYGSLAEDLATGLQSWALPSLPIKVKLYDAQGEPPNYPIAEHSDGPATPPASNTNRELALCLSFYSEHNAPRRRGRLYVPMCLAGISAGGTTLAGAGEVQKVADLVDLFTNLGGVDIDWGIYSRTDDAFRKATHWFVDNSWDVVRSRGLVASSRLTGTTDE